MGGEQRVFEAPSIVELEDSTILVPPGWTASEQTYGLVLERGQS